MKIYRLFLFLMLSVLLAACEDEAPMDYIENYYVEAYLIVGDPVQKIKVMKSQPLNTKFVLENSLIKNATVKITEYTDFTESTVSAVLNLKYQDTGLAYFKGYYFDDPFFKVKPLRKYKFELIIGNNIITGETYTPDSMRWKKFDYTNVQYPLDSINIPNDPKLEIEWEFPNPGYKNFIQSYLLSTDCLDTTYYGKYLTPQTDEKNRRIYNMLYKHMEENSTNSPFYKEKTYWAFITNQKSQTVWMAFKWFGKHEVSIYSPDFNMLRWYMNTVFSQEHNDLANSVKSNNNNVIGVFGSASVVRKEIFLLKNQP